MPPSRTIVRDQPARAPMWAAVILLGSLVGTFGLATLFLTYNHVWTDRLTAYLPWPGASTSLAADPTLAAQMRIVETSARVTTLADRTQTVVAEAVIENTALIPVQSIVVEGYAYREGRPVQRTIGTCGKLLSEKLLRRLPRPELLAFTRLEPEVPHILDSGEGIDCQLAFVGVHEGVDEVALKIASVEPMLGHRPPRLGPGE